MKFNFKYQALILAMMVPVASFSQVASVSAEQVVEAMEKINGITPGARRNHINGVCASGTFVGAKEIQAYSRSPLFSGQSIPVEARFSLAGGNPKAPDTAKSPRGLGIQFKLPDNSFHHFTMLNVPVFSVSSPRAFYEALLAGTPDATTDKVDPEKMKAFRASHPDSLPLAEFMAKNNPPVSYVNSDFYSVHTFKFINKDNKTTLVRWRFVPEEGVKRLTDEEMKSGPSQFLDQKLIDKAKQGPIRWNMVLTLGEPGDEQVNPTVYWPTNRKEVKAGVLTFTTAALQADATCGPINFDPLVMSDGVAPTDDPVLLFRSPAYANSFSKRLTGR
ncbi:MAG: catalase [Rhodoferax sp.]|jgi:catalase